MPIPHFSYTRAINKNLSIQASYSYWRQRNWTSLQSSVDFADFYDITNSINKHYASNKFKYFDLQLQYTKHFNKIHSISIAAGPSHVTFSNYYIESISYIIQPNGSVHIISISGYGKPNLTAIGAVVGTAYNYTFWKEWLHVGADVSDRIYPNHVGFHIVYGAHIGFNF